jgi:hypothetical protein
MMRTISRPLLARDAGRQLSPAPSHGTSISTRSPKEAAVTTLDRNNDARSSGHGKAHSGHGWMMIVCCIPMLVIAIVFVATGVAGVGFVFAAIMCTAMMVMMMRMMSGGDGHDGGEQR